MGVPALPLDNEERDLLRQVGRRTGLSLDNARLYAREHLVAETLQRSMLPEVVDVPGLDVWSFYAPGMQHAQIGGDWYDVLRIDDGTVGLVIGDVVGHDIEAASAMGQLRSVVRAYSADGDDPAAVLMRVDQLVGGMRITRSASLVYATLHEQGEGGWEMSWARAGHLPPILVHDGKATALMGAGGPMVGLVAGPRESADLLLSPGDVLVLYTDGLIERRARPMKTGLDRLVEICGDLGVSDAAGIGERLLIELGDEPEDDIALVVLRVPVPGEPPLTGGTTHSRRWQLPGEASSIPRARALTTQMCDLWRLPQSRQAELVVSELVANAVLHGHGTVSLHVREAPDRGLRIEVGDANPTPPRRVDGHPDRTGGFGLTVVGTVAQWGWRAESMGKVVWALVPASRGLTPHDCVGPERAAPGQPVTSRGPRGGLVVARVLLVDAEPRQHAADLEHERRLLVGAAQHRHAAGPAGRLGHGRHERRAGGVHEVEPAQVEHHQVPAQRGHPGDRLGELVADRHVQVAHHADRRGPGRGRDLEHGSVHLRQGG